MTETPFSQLLNRLNAVAHDRRRATEEARALCQVALPRLSTIVIDEADAKLGFAVPLLLRLIYTHVGNGGFGPGNGLIPLIYERSSNDDMSVVSEYLNRRSHSAGPRRSFRWPERMLPIADCGCGQLACVLAAESDDLNPPVITFEPNLGNEHSTRQFLNGRPFIAPGFLPVMKSLSVWLEEWLDRTDSEQFD